MNRTLTAAAAFVAGSAGAVGIAGTAAADPTELPTVLPVDNAHDIAGTVHSVPRSVGSVVPAHELVGKPMANTGERLELPLAGPVHGNPVDVVVKATDSVPTSTNGSKSGTANGTLGTVGKGAPTQLHDSALNGLPKDGLSTPSLPAGLAGGSSPVDGLLMGHGGSTKADPLGTARDLVERSPVGQINALSQD
jgi:hypothetical protein